MGNFNFNVPALGDKFIDYRMPILGNSFTWNWVRPLTQVKYLTIHHTAGPKTQTPDDIANYHVNSLGWGGIGYHFVITNDGKTYYVGDLTTARAHVYNYNHSAIGIVLTGTFMNGKLPTDDQLQSAHELCSQLLFRTPELPGVDGWEDLVGHKQLQATACPGDTWNNYKNKIVTGIESNEDQEQQRLQAITQLYQIVLGREPDQQGLDHFYNSEHTIEEIRKIMTESNEHKNNLAKANAYKQAVRIAIEGKDDSTEVYDHFDRITKLL